jgi:hypothetical protein
VLTEDEYLAIKKEHEDEIAADERKVAEWKAAQAKLPAKERKNDIFAPSVHHWWDEDKYHPYSQDSVYYDDITKAIQQELERHNRLVLVLQGLLDRSPVLHPHPPWSLWNPDSFNQALVLHYDSDRALTTGDPPDFELYRDNLNGSIKPGSITVGQQRVWLVIQKEKDREDGRRRRYRDRGEGPGKLAHVVQVHSRAKTVLYQWTRERSSRDGATREIGCKFTTKIKNVFNVSAYKPGDFKQFFADPRTRENYIRWAPLLLEAEEFHAGNREVAPVKPLPPSRRQIPGGSPEYQKRKRNKALVGEAVRLRRDVTTRSGKHFPRGTLFRVRYLERGTFEIERIDAKGQWLPEHNDWEKRQSVRKMEFYDLIWDTTIPKPEKDNDDK